jgi:hypothetical protein
LFTASEAEQPVPPGTVENVEVPQPQVAMPVDNEAHQPKATANEDVQSGRVESSTATPSAPALELPMTSSCQAQ